MHVLKHLVDELPPTNPEESDPFRNTLFVDRHNLKMRLRRLLSINQMDELSRTLLWWVVILTINQIALIVVLYHVLTKG